MSELSPHVEEGINNPHLRLYIDKDARNAVEGKMGDVELMLGEWESDMVKHRAVDIIALALLETEDDVVYRIMNRLGYKNKVLNYFVSFTAAIYEREEVIIHMVENGYNDWDKVALCFALVGNIIALNGIIDAGATDYVRIAGFAALGGHTDIVKAMLNKGVTNYGHIAGFAALGGHKNIFYNMINREAVSIDALEFVAKLAAQGGNMSLIRYVVRRGARNFNDIAIAALGGGYINVASNIVRTGHINPNKIATTAAAFGYKNIVTNMINNGANDLLMIAKGAAEGGHNKILRGLINLYIRRNTTIAIEEWDSLILFAAAGGHKDTIKLLLDKGGNLDDANFGEHEDARLYFS